MAMVSDLRERCPWDRVQTRETLRPYLVEEALELDYALGEGDGAAIREEVSDLLLHLAWQLVLARELREFSPDDVADDLERKMKRRHPHLFDLGPRERWESLKQKEKITGRRRREGTRASDAVAAIASEVEVLDEDGSSAGPMRIIPSERYRLKPLSPEDAVMELEGTGEDILVFRDSASYRVNVVYRRRDGHFGLVDPEF